MTAPAACLPACRSGDPSPDHRCVVRLATVPCPARPDGRDRALVVELDREDDGRRTVILAAVDRTTGRYVGDPIEVAPADVVRAAAALLRAGVLAVRS